MNRSEFIRELREALKSNISEADVQENVRYYTGYIEEEVKKGRSEKEVIDELGDPWLIAKTISITPGNQSSYQSYESAEGGYVRTERDENDRRVHVWNFNSKWKIILLLVAIVAVLFLVFSIISGIISLLMPIIGPLLVIVIIIKIFSNRRN